MTNTNLTNPVPYATSIRAGDFIFISGQVPRDASRKIVGVTIEEQTAAVFENMRTALQQQGVSIAHVVKLQVCLADIDDWSRFNDEYLKQIGGCRPVRTTIGCALNGVKVEIDAVAYSPLSSAECGDGR